MAKSESAVSSEIQLALAYAGAIVQRNNVGACEDKTGRIVRYGLMNESSQMNKRFKSSDLICPVPVLITPQMVGTVIGAYVAIEAKREDWKFRETDEHALAQMRYHDIIRSVGGFAGFARSPQEALRIIGIRT